MVLSKLRGNLLNWKIVSLIFLLSAFLLGFAEYDRSTLLGLFLSYYQFILAVFFLIYLPGKFINNLIKAKLHFFEELFLSCVYGILLFALTLFTFSYLKVEIIGIAIIGVIDFLVIKDLKKPKVKFRKIDAFSYSAIVLMSLIFALPMLTSGYVGDSLRLIGVNNYDGLWYLALINELKFSFPPQHPGFAGEMLIGYHFFLFFVMAKLGNLFNLSNIDLMFKLFPPLVSLLWGIGVYVLMFNWSKNRVASLFAVFFTMFGGSAVYIAWLYGHKNISLDSGFGVLQPATSLVNPTYAISIVFLTAFLLSVYKYYKLNSIRWFIPIALIAGLTPIFKVYGGIIILGGFILFVLWELYKRNLYILPFSLGVIVLFFTAYWPFTDKGAHLIFHPLWAPHNVLNDNLPWYGYEEKIRTYSNQGVIRGVVITEAFSLFVFIFGNLGTRLIGLAFGGFFKLKQRKLPSIFALLVWAMAGASIVIPLLFIQSGKVFETIQFMWYFLFFMSLFSAFGFGYILVKLNKFVGILIALIVILLTIPSAVAGIKNYVFAEGGYVEKLFYDSTNFLLSKGKYDEIVLSLPRKDSELTHAALKRGYRAGRPIIPAIANKRSFLSYEYFPFEVNVDERIDLFYKMLLLERLIDSENQEYKNLLKAEIEKRLKLYNVNYIHSPDPLKSLLLFDSIKEVYKNSGAFIYEVN